MEPIAERRLIYKDEAGREHDVLVVIAKPQEDRGAWKCEYSITGAYQHTSAAHGGDSVQALMLAMQAVAAHLNAPKLRGRVTMPASDGHGFPDPPHAAHQ